MGSSKLILVNQEGIQIGYEDKIKTHREGLLHRAYSVFLFNNKGEMLLQKRAECKYHSPLLWANSCCSHPDFDCQDILESASRSLKRELGIEYDKKNLNIFSSMVYKVYLGSGMTENEYVYFISGKIDDSTNIKPNDNEVEKIAWMSIEMLRKEVNSPVYAKWIQIYMQHRYIEIKNQYEVLYPGV